MKFRRFYDNMKSKRDFIRCVFALWVFATKSESQELFLNSFPVAGNSITAQMKQFLMMKMNSEVVKTSLQAQEAGVRIPATAKKDPPFPFAEEILSLEQFPKKRVESIRRQRLFPPSYPFPCENFTDRGRSYRRPTSVHRLKPGDIDVVGAMGDSLVAGNGALEEYAIGTVIEYRGVSWCAGGEGTWRQYLTLPNILKEFNPKLKGYSIGKGEFLSKNSGMNVAFPVSADADAVMQAKYLVKKMKKHSDIDFYNDWKMITIFFGANDLCSSQCFNREGTSAIQHRRKLMDALDYLYENLPRTFVNLIPVLDVTVSVRQKRSMMCRFLHRLFCTCFHTGSDVNEFDIISQLVLDYQNAEKQLVQSGRYDAKEDFTVVLQPFMTAFNAPADIGTRYKPFIDKSYITYDCFHFSQKGHALGANMLWNNLLEPVGRKSKKQLDYIMQEFRCPTKEAPYFFTNINSKTFLTQGTQVYYEL